MQSRQKQLIESFKRVNKGKERPTPKHKQCVHCGRTLPARNFPAR